MSELTAFVLRRLNHEEGEGAWCPQEQPEPSDSQYLQVRICWASRMGTCLVATFDHRMCFCSLCLFASSVHNSNKWQWFTMRCLRGRLLAELVVSRQTAGICECVYVCEFLSKHFIETDPIALDDPGGSGQADLPDGGRHPGTIRQELRQRVHPRLPPQLQPGRPAVEVLEEPAGEHGEAPAVAGGFGGKH